MPVEIKELHIRVAVDGRPDSGGAGQAASKVADGDGDQKDAIVAECVEQVLEILQAKRDR